METKENTLSARKKNSKLLAQLAFQANALHCTAYWVEPLYWPFGPTGPLEDELSPVLQSEPSIGLNERDQARAEPNSPGLPLLPHLFLSLLPVLFARVS